jgi:hypothetical protein
MLQGPRKLVKIGPLQKLCRGGLKTSQFFLLSDMFLYAEKKGAAAKIKGRLSTYKSSAAPATPRSGGNAQSGFGGAEVVMTDLGKLEFHHCYFLKDIAVREGDGGILSQGDIGASGNVASMAQSAFCIESTQKSFVLFGANQGEMVEWTRAMRKLGATEYRDENAGTLITLSLVHYLSCTPFTHSSHTLPSHTPLVHSSHTLLSYTPLVDSSLLHYTALVHSSRLISTPLVS